MATATNPSNVSSVADKAKQAASEFGRKAEDAAYAATSGVKSFGENVRDKGEDVANAAKQAASDLGRKAEDATHAVGSGLKSLGETIRQKGPAEGALGSATSSVASGLESGGQYLQQQGIKGIADDMTNLIRNNPIPALLVGVGLGFLLARATMRR
jgi:ElaB/YqjD/DUF883 family membrane-anchored ribosome-binding protein